MEDFNKSLIPPIRYPVRRPWTSLCTVLVVQTQNAFNDNFLKFVLIWVAGVVAQGNWLGDNAQRILATFIPLAFILFSPLAGYLSDRYSKREVLFWCLVVQLFILALTILAVSVESLSLSILCLFLLSIQSTFFSPSKQGILKELVGSRRLTVANGMLQMLTMLAILAGGTLGGAWFGERQGALGDPWSASFVPILAISLAALVPLIIRFLVDPTPAHIDTRFEPAILVKHFHYLGDLFSSVPLKKTSIGVAYYWLAASFFGVVIFDFAKEMHPDIADGKASTESSIMFFIVGLGIMAGSILVSIISRNGINLRLIPVGGGGMTLCLVGTGLLPPGSAGFSVSILLLGFFGAGFYLVPLSSYLQDVAPNEKRGRIMAASAVLVSICGVVAIVISQVLTLLRLSPGHQMLLFVIPTLLMTWYVCSLIKYRESEEIDFLRPR